MWQQLNVARSLDTTQIWILNVGDLHFLETPTEYFLSLAYDFDAFDRGSLLSWSASIALRDFGVDEKVAKEIAQIMALYSVSEAVRSATSKLRIDVRLQT